MFIINKYYLSFIYAKVISSFKLKNINSFHNQILKIFQDRNLPGLHQFELGSCENLFRPNYLAPSLKIYSNPTLSRQFFFHDDSKKSLRCYP